MPSIIDEHFDIFRRTQPIIFVIDSSSSNQGYPMALINSMIKDCVKYLKEIDADSDCAIRIGMLKFNIGCEWITKNLLLSPNDIEMQWDDIIPSGYGELGCALHELNSKLSRQELLYSYSGICRPIILFITDGAISSIDEQFLDAIKTLWSNKLFVCSIRLAMCVGNIYNKDVLFNLVGNGGIVTETGKSNHENGDKLIPLISILLKKMLEKGFIDSELLKLGIKLYCVDSQLMGQEVVLLDEPISNADDSWDEDD